MLSIVYGPTRFHSYTYGRKVTVYNGHKPLATILKKSVEDNPVRRQRIFCRIMAHDLEFKYVKGKDLLIADALSSSPTMNQNRSKIEQEIETIRLLTEDPRVTNCLSEIAEEQPKMMFYSSTVLH